MKDSFYRLNKQLDKPIHIIISNLGFGKSYRELLKYVNNYNENEYPPKYYMNKGAIEVIDYLLGDDKDETNS